MKTKFFKTLITLCLISTAASAFAASPMAAAQASVKKAYAEAVKGLKNVNYAKQVEVYRALRAEPRFATNRFARLHLTDSIVKNCRVQGMHTINNWDKKLEKEIPAETRLILDDPVYSLKEKLPFADALMTWQASEAEDFAAAEKTVEALAAAFPKATPAELVDVEMLRFKLYKWQDRFDDAWKTLERVSAVDKRKAAGAASGLAGDLGDYSKATPFWRKLGDESEEFLNYGWTDRFDDRSGPKDCRERAKAYVEDTTKPLDRRAALVTQYFCLQHTDEERRLRSLVKGADFSKNWQFGERIRRAYQFADYELLLDLLELNGGKSVTRMPPAAVKRLKLIALAATGRREEAAALAEKEAGAPDVKPLDKAKFLMSLAMLRGGDVRKTMADAKLAGAQAAEVWRTGARQALIWGDSETSELCAAEHDRIFADFPKRRMKVAWSEHPLTGVQAWREIAPKLDRQYCDLKYKMSMDDLVTDVATGRSPVEASALDSDDARMELSAVCDCDGLHLFLRVEDPNARAVQNGFAGGMKTEMYFAAGADRPYACFGTSPRGGVDFSFQTQYDNLGHSRLDFTGLVRRGWFKCETEFTDVDYVEHLFFAWDNFYRELPADGTAWKYDCISWTPKGGYTWAGSQGPHSCMAWGDLVFSLTPEAITRIRKGLLLRTHGVWRKTGRLDVFAKWADDEIGDPGFYAERLKPLQTELAAAMSGVKPDMSDEEVNRIFELALAKCRGLKHEIDALRKDYLRRELCK